MKTNLTSIFGSARQIAIAAGPSKSIALSLIVSIAIAYFLYDQVYHPQYLDSESKAQRLAELRAQNKADEELAASMPEFLDNLNRAEKDYGVVRAFLPDAPEVSVVLDAVQKLAVTRRVRLTLFRDTGAGAKSALADKLNERPVPIQLFGRHTEIARFMSDLASYPRILHIRDLAITAERPGQLVDATLVCYFAPTPNDVPPLPYDVQQTLSRFTGGSKQQ